MTQSMVIDLSGMVPARRALQRLGSLDIDRLLQTLGSELESQTRRRISEEKTDPEGRPWAPWSENYESKPGGKMLERDGNLLDSLAFEVDDDAVTVGSNMVYAATHQYGRSGIPARPYLGVSVENVDDLNELVINFIREEFGG